MSHKKDFRNMKQTQFDRGQVLKGSFSELNSALRTVGTNAILKDSYTHFSQTTNANGLPLEVTYFQATEAALDEITLIGDNNGSLAGTYIALHEFLTKKTHVYYYVVDGSGMAPNIGDAETPINISLNDNASTVTFATKTALEVTPEFIVKSKSYLANTITLEYLQFGETSAVNVDSTGFSVSRLEEGNSIQVGYVELTYDADNNPIYNGNTLKGLLYNPYTASFDVERSEVNATVNLDPILSSVPTIIEVTMPTANQEYSFTLPTGTKKFRMNIRDNKSPYSIGYSSGGTFFSNSYGFIYEEDNLKIITDKEIYFTAKKSNVVMEIIIWG